MIDLDQEKLKSGITEYLQPLSFKLEESFMNDIKIKVVYLPEKWISIFQEIKRFNSDIKKRYKNNEERKKKTIRYSLFGRSLIAKNLDIFAFSFSAESLLGKEPWLFIKDIEIEDLLERVKLFFYDWIVTINCSDELNFPAQLVDVDALLNENFRLDKLPASSFSEKTYFRKIMSGYFADQFTKNAHNITFKTEPEEQRELSFFHVLEDEMHEAISEPICVQHINSKTKDVMYYYFSYCVQFSATTIPYSKEVELNLKVESKCWITSDNPIRFTKNDANFSIYLGYMDRNISTKLFKAKVKCNFLDEGEMEYVLEEDYSKYIKNLNSESVKEWMDNTRSFINPLTNKKGIFIGCAPSQSLKSWIKGTKRIAESGISTIEKIGIFEAVERLFPNLKRADFLVPSKSSRFKVGSKGKTAEEVKFSSMRRMKKGNAFVIEVWSETKEFVQSIKEELEKMYDGELSTNEQDINKDGSLRFNKQGKPVMKKKGVPLFKNNEFGEYFFQDYIGAVKFKLVHIKPEIAHKPLPVYDNKTKDTIIATRILEIQKEIEKKSITLNGEEKMVLFEIPNYHKSFNSEKIKRDPYSAIRRAFLEKGYRIQFVNSDIDDLIVDDVDDGDEEEKESGNLSHRIRKAFLDMFSKKGYIMTILEKQWTEHNVYAFDFINLKDKEFPVMVRYNEEGVYLRLVGMSDWIEYNNVTDLVMMCIRASRRTRNVNDFDLLRVIQAELSVDHKKKILYLPASLRRQNKFLQNSSFDDLSKHFTSIEQLTVIRWNDFDDVPDYYIKQFKKKKDQLKWFLTFNSGVFLKNDHVCYNISQRGDQIKTGVDQIKLKNARKSFKKRRIMETVAFSNMQKDVTDYFFLTAALRKLDIAYETSTNLPYPLFILKQLEEEFKDL